MNRTVSVSSQIAARWTQKVSTEFYFLIGFLLAGWYRTFTEMWSRWFPVWNDTTLSIWQRLTEGDSYYTHGPLVPFVSLALAIYIYRQAGVPIRTTRNSTIAGWFLLTPSLLIHLVRVYIRVTFLSGFALIGVIGGLVLLYGGLTLLRTYFIPLVLLVFMVPLPLHWIAGMNLTLKTLAARCSVNVMSEILQIPVILDGSYLLLSPNSQGQPRSLLLEDTCSGLRSLITLVWITCLIAATSGVSRKVRAGLVLLSFPLAIGCNVLRICLLILVAHFITPQTSGPDHWVHNFSGTVMFVAALGVMIAFEKTGRTVTYRKVDLTQNKVNQYTRMSRLSIGLIAVAAGLSIFWNSSDRKFHQGNLARQAAPSYITLEGIQYPGSDITLSRRILGVLETNDYVFRRYAHPSTAQPVELLIVFSADNPKATHPPEVCLEGSGQPLVLRQDRPVKLDASTTITMKELVAGRGNDLQYYLYVYKYGSTYTADFMTQQAGILYSNLMRDNSSSALIRLSVPVTDRDVEQARTLAIGAAREIVRSMNRELP